MDKTASAAALRRLWIVALAVGAAALAAALAWVVAEPGLDAIWAIAAFGVGVVAYNLAFFGLCSLRAPWLADWVRDATEVKGDTVTHVVRHGETGDARLDFYLRAYAAARGVSAAAIGAAALASLALIFF